VPTALAKTPEEGPWGNGAELLPRQGSRGLAVERQVASRVLLEQDAPKLRMYPPELVIAEKLEAAVSLGVANNGAKSVDEFFVVNGFDVITAGRWQDNPGRAARMDITKELWKARRTLGQLYMTPEFRNYRLPWGKRRNPPFGWKWGTSQASFTAKGDATLVLNGERCRVSACDDYGQYLGGGWLEEYVCSLLRELEERGVIHDVRIGLEVNYSGKSQHFNEPPSGECDCVFTDGKRLWLVECKAGDVKQEHIQKLENNLKIHGGIAARGILVSAFPIHAAHAKRLKSSTSIRVIPPEDLRAEVLERVIAS